MPTKTKKDTVVPFMKVKHIEVRKLGTRLTKDFEDELRALFEDGYKVASMTKKGDAVVLQLAKTEEWTFAELMAEVNEQLTAGQLNARIEPAPALSYPSFRDIGTFGR